MNRAILWTCSGVLALSVGACDDKTKPPTIGEGPFKPPPIVVSSNLPEVKIDGATGSLPLSSAASYAWSAFIAINWPSSTTTRGAPDTTKTFGQAGAPAWVTMRSKVELYPGNGSATVPPHGVTLDGSGKPNNGPAYGYSDAVQYAYAASIAPCTNQTPVTTPAYITLDETTQINNNQVFAGSSPATDPNGYNTKPQLIRYAVKMNQPVYATAVGGQYWYGGNVSPLATAKANYVKALGSGQDPNTPYVNFAPTVEESTDPNDAGVELKTSWRPLNPTEQASGRFFTTTVRYYEQPSKGVSCYREGVWGLVGMHLISFSVSAPWVIWSSFEQADNILTASGQPVEDVNGKVLIPAATPTSPALASNPNQTNPTVTKTGDYCTAPGKQLFFQENPNYGTMPSGGNICVNGRFTQPEPIFVNANTEAHTVMAAYLKANNIGTSPLMYYKLVAAQGVPVDASAMNAGTFSTTVSYYSANSTIETDYSMGQFTGRLAKGVPSNVQADGSMKPYYNTNLLPFQTGRLGFGNMQMGGCAGCHDNGALIGKDFSFALGNNVTAPEATNAFATNNLLRQYFPLK